MSSEGGDDVKSSHSHRRIISAVEGSYAQRILLDSIAGNIETVGDSGSHNVTNEKDTTDTVPFEGGSEHVWNQLAMTNMPSLPVVEPVGPSNNGETASSVAFENDAGLQEDEITSDEEDGNHNDTHGPLNRLVGANDDDSYASGPIRVMTQKVTPVSGVGSSKVSRIRNSSSANIPRGMTTHYGGKRKSSTAKSTASSKGYNSSAEMVIKSITKHLDRNMIELENRQRRDIDRLTSMLQSEYARRDALSTRLHAQLLMQAESMVAMELKLMRLEAQINNDRRGRGSINSRGRSGNLDISGSAANVQQQQQQQYQPFPGIVEEGRGKPLDTILTSSSVAGVAGGSGSVGGQNHHVPRTGSGILYNRGNISSGTLNSAGGHQRASTASGGGSGLRSGQSPTNLIGAQFVSSSAASLASGVTEEPGLDDDETEDEEDEGIGMMEHQEISGIDGVRSRGRPGGRRGVRGTGSANNQNRLSGQVDEIDGHGVDDSSDSTPQTQSSSRARVIFPSGPNNIFQASDSMSLASGNTSIRATRGPPDPADEMSSIATSFTSTTVGSSTVVTATTAGARSFLSGVGSRIAPSSNARDTTYAPISSSVVGEEEDDTVSGVGMVTLEGHNEHDGLFGAELSPRPSRSRSQSPLTVQESVAQDHQEQESVAEEQSLATNTSMASMGINSTAAVASYRAFTGRRSAAAAAAAAAATGDVGGRQFTNRVVSFVMSPPPIENIPQAFSEVGDSVTMPDELDNMSNTDASDAFANSARMWREDYETRLDAIQKRWVGP